MRLASVALICGFAFSCVLNAPRAHAATPVPWLYEVAVPVENQSPRERQRASSDALLIMLTRATGLSLVPRSEAVVDALADADAYYSEFRFANREREEDGLDLIIQFDPRAVLALLKRAELPIWRSARDRIVAWLVVDADGERQLLGATSALELGDTLVQRSRDRGLDLSLPLLDLEDQLTVSPAVVWGRLSQVLEPASERYGADVLMIGRLKALPGGDWSGEWEFWLNNQVIAHQTGGTDLLTQAAETIDLLADELAARNAVFGRQVGQLKLAISGIRNAADYGRLLGYLKSLEFVDSVFVRQLLGERLWIDIETRAEPDQLGALFEADRQLFPDRLALLDAADLQLVWRAR
jgi:hypothetical protein